MYLVEAISQSNVYVYVCVCAHTHAHACAHGIVCVHVHMSMSIQLCMYVPYKAKLLWGKTFASTINVFLLIYGRVNWQYKSTSMLQ